MIPKNVKDIMQVLLDNKFEAYIVGGAVRDKLLNVVPHDYDIFTNCGDILKYFPQGKVLGGEERQEKILTVIVNTVEVSQYRANGDRTETGTSLEQHQSTCDLTINSMAMRIDGGLHYTKYTEEGLRDLNILQWYNSRDKIIVKFVGNATDRLKEDPLRLLRAIRFKAKYNGYLNLNKVDMDMRKQLIESLPPERVREELLKIMEYDTGLDVLHEFGLLELIIPELYHENMLKSGGEHHDETPLQHCLNSFKVACGVTNHVLLRLACTLHDVGKGVAREESTCKATEKLCFHCEGEICEDYEHEIHFYQHEVLGCDIARELMQRLKFSTQDTEYVCYLIRKHMFGYKGPTDDKSHKPIKKKTYVKFFNKLDENHIRIMDFIILIYCDHQGNEKKRRFKFGDFVGSNFLLGHYWECKYDNNSPFTVTDLEISGRDLIDMGVKPGPVIGRLLQAAFDDVMDGHMENSRPVLMKAMWEHLKEEESEDSEEDEE